MGNIPYMHEAVKIFKFLRFHDIWCALSSFFYPGLNYQT